ARDQHDEAGKILVLAAEAVRYPGSDRGPARARRAGIDEELRRGVVELVGPHRADHAQLVGDPVEMRERVGEPHAALAISREGPSRAEEHRRARSEREALAAKVALGARLAIETHELGLVVEEIEVRRR